MNKPANKQILFSILFVLLFIPYLQQELDLFNFKPLTGEFIPTAKQKFSSAGWFSGEYQAAFDKNFEENIGFRNPLIRLYNQVDLSLFNLAHGGDIVVGKQGYLFQTQYLTAHAGMDFIGEKEIDARMERVRFVSDQLRNKGILLIVAFAPTKADFFPEYLPSRFVRKDTAQTNYDHYRKKLLESNVNFIDFNDYFLKLKNASAYPLFPKQGIHWSQYGVYLVVDSLLKYIPQKSGIDLNRLYCDRINMSYELKSTDYDLGDLCNVMFEMPHDEMPYPELKFESNPAKRKPNVLAIGDSFYWNVYNSGVPRNIFNGAHFWYYNHDVYADWIPQREVVDLKTFIQEIEKQEVILILQTESNLNNLGLGFIENAYDMYQGKATESPVLKVEDAIRNNPEWMESIKKKAAERNISIDAMIRADAEWSVEQERLKKK